MLPAQRKSRSAGRKGRSHQGIKRAQYVECPNPTCRQPKLPHCACVNCGYVRPGLSIKTGKED